MLDLIVGAIISAIVMYICQSMAIIPNTQWNWPFFLTGIILWGTIKIAVYKSMFHDAMQNMLKMFNDYFSVSEALLLEATAGHIMPILMLGTRRRGPSALSFATSIISVILCVASYYHKQSTYAAIALSVFILNPKFWSPSPFFIDDPVGNVETAFYFYLKAQNRHVASEEYSEALDDFRDIFFRVQNKLFELIEEKGKNF